MRDPGSDPPYTNPAEPYPHMSQEQCLRLSTLLLLPQTHAVGIGIVASQDQLIIFCL